MKVPFHQVPPSITSGTHFLSPHFTLLWRWLSGEWMWLPQWWSIKKAAVSSMVSLWWPAAGPIQVFGKLLRSRPGTLWVSPPLWNEGRNVDLGLEGFLDRGRTEGRNKSGWDSADVDCFVYFSHGGLSAVPAPKYNACFILLHYWTKWE